PPNPPSSSPGPPTAAPASPSLALALLRISRQRRDFAIGWIDDHRCPLARLQDRVEDRVIGAGDVLCPVGRAGIAAGIQPFLFIGRRNFVFGQEGLVGICRGALAARLPTRTKHPAG